jgi:pSer/pThr/pTyr-binding forkhead associated (FHA) protein
MEDIVLMVVGGKSVGAYIDVVDTVQTVGRFTSNALRVDDPAVSRVHLLVWREGGDLWLADASSSNGTLLNGRRVFQCRLAIGDTIAIGETLVRCLELNEAARVFVQLSRPFSSRPLFATSRLH